MIVITSSHHYLIVPEFLLLSEAGMALLLTYPTKQVHSLAINRLISKCDRVARPALCPPLEVGEVCCSVPQVGLQGSHRPGLPAHAERRKGYESPPNPSLPPGAAEIWVSLAAL